MRLSYRGFELRLVHPFTIARSSKSIEPSILVAVDHEGITGVGEAAPSERYGETMDSVLSFLGDVDLTRFPSPFDLEEILTTCDAIAPGNTSAKAAVDIALHDWIGRRLSVPLWKLWGLNRHATPLTSFTIGIDRPDIIEEKVREAEQYPILKVKVGVPDDKEIVSTIRRMTGKRLRVDANEGWTSREQALEKILWLETQGVEFVEQPLPASQLDDTAWLRERVHIPLIADENVTRLHDLHRLRGVFDGINIKLMKCGGLREALRMIHTARALGLSIMLGCMIESSVAISAAAQLSPLVDYADLDGNLLIANDPYGGVIVREGKLVLSDAPGIGVRERE